MPDKTPLNPNLPDDLLAIESAFGSLPVPESTIDHNSVLYQAGWAAAMAERDSAIDENSLPRSGKTKSQLWPAVAMTFAASTAACLAIIVWGQPSANETTMVAARHSSAATSPDHHSLTNNERSDALPSTPALSTGSKRIPFESYQSNLAALIGLPHQPSSRSRKAQLERLLDDAAEPVQFVTSATAFEEDIDAEAEAPLTTGSPLPDVF